MYDLPLQISAQIIKEASRAMSAHGARVGPRVHAHHHAQRGQPDHLVLQAGGAHPAD